MDCTSWDDEAAARYAGGAMPDEESAAFEDHYFDCDGCLARVQALQAAAHVTAEAPAALAPAAAAAAARKVAPRFPAWVMAAALGAVALAAALTLRPGVGPSPPSASPSPAGKPGPDPRLLALARAEPYPYVPFAPRGGGDEAFAQAMGRYLDHDYAGAATSLRAVLERAPQAREPRFYLGVSELLAGDAAAAEKDLAQAAATGDDALAGPAGLYLARARLARRDTAGARAALDALITSKSSQAPAARTLLAELDAVEKTQ